MEVTKTKTQHLFTPVLPVIREPLCCSFNQIGSDHTSNQGYNFGDEGNRAVRTSTPVSVTYKLRGKRKIKELHINHCSLIPQTNKQDSLADELS